MIAREHKKAVGLKYDPAYPAPFVTARSRGELAQKMIRLAKEEGIPVLELQGISEELFLLDPGAMIPEDLFPIVAEIFSFIYSIQEQT